MSSRQTREMAAAVQRLWRSAYSAAAARVPAVPMNIRDLHVDPAVTSWRGAARLVADRPAEGPAWGRAAETRRLPSKDRKGPTWRASDRLPPTYLPSLRIPLGLPYKAALTVPIGSAMRKRAHCCVALRLRAPNAARIGACRRLPAPRRTWRSCRVSAVPPAASTAGSAWPSVGGKSMSTADQTRQGDAAPTASGLSDQELDQIIFRAAALGVPAWRVTTALGLPTVDGAPLGIVAPTDR